MKASEEWARMKLSECLTRRGLKFSCEKGENPPDLLVVVALPGLPRVFCVLDGNTRPISVY